MAVKVIRLNRFHSADEYTVRAPGKPKFLNYRQARSITPLNQGALYIYGRGYLLSPDVIRSIQAWLDIATSHAGTKAELASS